MIHLLGNTYLVDILDQISEQIRVNNLISNKLLLMEHRKQYGRVEEESLWRIIDHYQGEEFSTIRNKVFKYEVESEYLVIEEVSRKISKRNIMSAVSYLPIEKPSDIKHIYGGSYIYAILTDKRID